MTPGAALIFLYAETVICLKEDGRNRLKVFQLSRKTPAAARRLGNIMP